MLLSGRNLSIELHGDDVKLLQSELGLLGLKLPPNETGQSVFGPFTRRAVMEFQKKFSEEGLKVTGIVDEATARLINREVDRLHPPVPADGCTVRGTVRQVDGTPASGLRVVAFDRGLIASRPLGDSQTNADGRYTISYQPAASTGPARVRPYMFVQAFAADGSVAAESETSCNAPCDSLVDLMIGGGRYAGPSEYETTITAIIPLLENLAIADLSKEQVVYLACRTGLERQILQYMVWAQKRGREQQLPPEALYGYAREGLPTALDVLLAQAPAILRRALENALADNLIPLGLRSRLDEIARLMQAAAARLLHEAPNRPPQATIAPLLAAAGLSAAEQRSFVTLHVANQASDEGLWKAVADDPALAPKAARIQLAIQVAALVRNHAPLIAAVLQAPQGGVTTMRDLAALPPASWTGLIAQSGVPDDVPGTNAAERATNYAATIVRTLEVLFPSAAFAARLKADLARPAPVLARFFDANPDFELRETHVDAYLAAKAAALDGVAEPAALVTELKRVQRVLRLTPKYEDVQRLLDHGLDSAQRIVRMGRAAFLAEHAEALGADRAQDIFDRARQIAATAALLYAQYAPLINSINLAVTANPTGKGG